MSDKMLLNLKSFSDDCLSLRLIDHDKKGSPRMLIFKDTILDNLTNIGSASDTDLDNTIRFTRLNATTVYCRITFINVGSNENITGYRRSFEIPFSVLVNIANSNSGEAVSVVVDRNKPASDPSFVFTPNAYAAIRAMDDLHRRAFFKCLRRSFCYGTKVTISKDFGQDFFFTEEANWTEINGGLCLSEDTVNGHRRLIYSKHT